MSYPKLLIISNKLFKAAWAIFIFLSKLKQVFFVLLQLY